MSTEQAEYDRRMNGSPDGSTADSGRGNSEPERENPNLGEDRI